MPSPPMSMPVSMPVSMPSVERSERQDDGEFSPPSGDFMGKSAINEDFDRKIEFFWEGVGLDIWYTQNLPIYDDKPSPMPVVHCLSPSNFLDALALARKQENSKF